MRADNDPELNEEEVEPKPFTKVGVTRRENVGERKDAA